jgi:hypothetical protein
MPQASGGRLTVSPFDAPEVTEMVAEPFGTENALK